MKRKRSKGENTIDKAYKGILYPDEDQKVLIVRTFGCCRFVYNRFLNERKTEYRENGRTVSYAEQCKELPGMKKDPETEWLREVDATALQNGVRNLQDDYDNFFLGLKEGRKVGYPRLKSKHDHRQSYRSTYINDNIRFEDPHHRLRH